MGTDYHTIQRPAFGNVQTVIIPAEMIAELEAIAEATPRRNVPWTPLEVSILREYGNRISRDKLAEYINRQCGNNRTRASIDSKIRSI